MLKFLNDNNGDLLQKKRLVKFFVAAAAFMLIAIAYNPSQYYYADLLVSLRMPLLVIALCFAMLLLIIKATYLGGSLSIICLISLSSLLPLHSLPSEQTKNAISIKQINLNYSNPFIESHLVRLQKQSWDVLILQEFSDLNRHLLSRFLTKASLFGYREVEGIPYGIVVISRLPIIYRQQVKLQGDRLGYIKLRLLFNNEVITTYIAHPPSPRTKQHWENRNILLAALHAATIQEQTPWLIAGDLNIVPWSRYFSWQSTQSCYGASPYSSFMPLNIKPTLLTGLPIDHCVFDEQFTLNSLIVSNFAGSDHKMLSYSLSLHD
ncbi:MULTISPECIES: endonuclease/exonuclease/phosphatase family protein [unclassified Pseudoalteromonas]|uniref:endonuclease/exonuclease/phosphatase family protein n=1 Tax=unclassified Pseudoalteromonas TaxID=194690 RepID=UPI002175FA1E|nr:MULTISPECIES: endonuclease/exonuclease/phosphatase family protein [unclassified Pseudoalteromonas]